MSSAGASSSSACRRAAIVTGSATRIGAASARAFHRAGYNVLLHYNTSDSLAQEMAAELNSILPGSAVVCRAAFSGFGLSDEAETLQAACKRVVRCAVEAFGDVHVLVNSASSYYPVPLVSADICNKETAEHEREIERKLDVLLCSNAVAPWFLTRAFAQHVAQRNAAGSGAELAEQSGSEKLHQDRCIVNLGDSLLSRPHANHSAYCMAKAALENLTITSSIELAVHGIRVNCVRPGYNVFPERMPEAHRQHHRDQVPLGKAEGTPLDIAQAILFLAESARYCTGTFIDVDGGLRHKPIL